MTGTVEVLVKRTSVSEVVVERGGLTVTASNLSRTVTVEQAPSTAVIEVGVVGPQGPPGPPGAAAPDGGTVFSLVTDQPIGGHRVVRVVDGYPRYADCTDATHANTVLGLTLGAAGTGETINVLRLGQVDEPTWNWVQGAPVYLGPGGVLTQAPPAGTSFYLIVGFPIAADRLFVSIREPIILMQ